MLEFNESDSSGLPADLTATLAYADREKSRLRVTLDSGEDAGIVLAHGSRLRAGEVLRSSDGLRVEIAAAAEPVSTIRTDDRRSLARISYHLGNRHVPLQIGDNWVRYERDHVLDAMAAGLGFEVVHESAPFEPEQGAYAHNRHPHAHAHHE